MPNIRIALSAATLPMTAIGLVIGAPAAYARSADQQTYHLPAQSLAASLRDLAVASGRSIVAPAELVTEKQVPALDGDYTVETAARILLAGSGLRVRAVADGFVIERGQPRFEPATSARAADADIVVTGSRIRGAPIASTVIALGQNEIRDAGQSTVSEAVKSIPQNFGGGQNPGIGFNVPATSGVDVGGGASINLRGLGSDATLMGVVGKHYASALGRTDLGDQKPSPLFILGPMLCGAAVAVTDAVHLPRHRCADWPARADPR